MKKYKCISGFTVSICNGDGFETDEQMIIETDTFWYTPEDENYRLVGGEVRLESDEIGWIEISKETLKECFEEVL
jgi:hypothetical protein